jgi:hypothetical protein
MSGAPEAEAASAAHRVEVVSGRPDATDLAALVTVLLARAAATGGAGGGLAARRSLWGAPATLVRRPGHTSPRSWGGPSATLRG